MQSYPDEAGLDLSSHSIAMELDAVEYIPTEEQRKFILNKAIASINDKDLFCSKSILVTTNLNKNDDYFDKDEVWAARSSPSHKPNNLEHDEHKIVGHMATSWAIDTDGNIIPDDTKPEDLPEVYHVVSGDVVYTVYDDEELKDRATKLIEGIKAGEMKVSMECIFDNFDYVLFAEDGSKDVVKRTKATAKMTKALRAYGGKGTFEGKKIGRVLRNITFTGKGYTKKPANKDSVILATEIENIESCNKSGVLSNRTLANEENNRMSENLELENKDLKAKLVAAEAQIAEYAQKKYEEQISKLEASEKALQSSVEAAKQETEEAKKKCSEEKAEKDKMKTKCDELEASLAKKDEELSAIKAQELLNKRVAMIVTKGYENAEASEMAKKFVGLNDEQFDVVVATMQTKSTETEPTETEEEKAAKAAEALKNAKPEEDGNLSAAATETDVETVRDQMIKAFASLKQNKAKK